jgi:hypothetical protein
MKKWFSNNKLYIIGAIAGAAAGFLYWQQIGCSSGTCMITSKPVNSTLYGSMMGALLLGMFKKETKKQVLNEDKKL